jgi:hypothetical protein
MPMPTKINEKFNKLINETSPYLLQHADNPVDWYPWGDEAFQKAKDENKPIFLSIGYSTCHWCHVMARESFQDSKVASVLNRYFVPIKVDKEERPDIDAVYMRVCQSMTGSGGWPLSIFMTPTQKPFMAGTYFPKDSFMDLLLYIADKWENDKDSLHENAELIIDHISEKDSKAIASGGEDLIERAVDDLVEIYDEEYGGFGVAPKFPAAHNLLFLLERYETSGGELLLKMVETTLIQMYRGGIFDHIGGGFCRYSTDRSFLVPHFEKMLYDNALLTLCYAKAYEITQKDLFLEIAERTADYILGEMTAKNGGFYAAQDADSEEEEGKYYLLTPSESISMLGEEANEFNRRFDITDRGNFEGKNIPNLLQSDDLAAASAKTRKVLQDFRKKRTNLFTDEKILTTWNGMMIAALSTLYRVNGKTIYLEAAQKAMACLKKYAVRENTLYVGVRDNSAFGKGFLDDYAYMIFALIQLYEATFDETYLNDAETFCDTTISSYLDKENGGFFFSGIENETLITPIKETYDMAIPCGNAVMCYNILLLSELTRNERYFELIKDQLHFMKTNSSRNPLASSFFLYAFNRHLYPAQEITCIPAKNETCTDVPLKVDLRTNLLMKKPNKHYLLLNDKTTYYVCQNHTCLPPTNDLKKLYRHPHKLHMKNYGG